MTAADLNKMYRENIGEEEILRELKVILSRYAKERDEDEHLVITLSVQELSKLRQMAQIFMLNLRKRDRNPVSFLCVENI